MTAVNYPHRTREATASAVTPGRIRSFKHSNEGQDHRRGSSGKLLFIEPGVGLRVSEREVLIRNAVVTNVSKAHRQVGFHLKLELRRLLCVALGNRDLPTPAQSVEGAA